MTVLVRTVLLAALFGTSAAAQTGGTPVETPPVPLSAEKQAIVKQHADQDQPPEARTDSPVTAGMMVPEDVELWSLPEDSVSEVPAVTRYKFLVTGKTIAVVDPETRKVVQVIPK